MELQPQMQLDAEEGTGALMQTILTFLPPC